jgi:hypothetical protein
MLASVVQQESEPSALLDSYIDVSRIFYLLHVFFSLVVVL